MMRLKIDQFCGLSGAPDFRDWLKSIAPDLLDELINNPKKGCKANQDKMIEIHRKLYDRKLEANFETFIAKRYSYLIIADSRPVRKTTLTTVPESSTMASGHIDGLNKHGVFRHYRPDLLTFPHKYIMFGSTQEDLERRVKAFIVDKLGVDYIVLDDYAYIEYFPRRYADIINQIKPEDREIYAFRKRMEQAKQ